MHGPLELSLEWPERLPPTLVRRDLARPLPNEIPGKHGSHWETCAPFTDPQCEEGTIVSTLVTGVFNSRERAERATDALTADGFSINDISLLMSDTTRGREFGMREATKAPEGAVTGATIGGVLGSIAAGLAAVGTLAIPGLSLVAAGPLLAALSGLGAGAAAGGIAGGLIGLGIPEHEAKFYNEELSRGGILLGVYTHDDNAKHAREVLQATGAEKVK